MLRDGAQALVMQGSLPSRTVAELALKHRLPAATFTRSFAEVGGLMSYGPNAIELVPARRLFRGQDSAGCQGRGNPGRAANQIRTRHQSQDRQGARPHRAADAARPRRRRDRASRHMPLFAHSRTSLVHCTCPLWRRVRTCCSIITNAPKPVRKRDSAAGRGVDWAPRDSRTHHRGTPRFCSSPGRVGSWGNRPAAAVRQRA